MIIENEWSKHGPESIEEKCTWPLFFCLYWYCILTLEVFRVEYWIVSAEAWTLYDLFDGLLYAASTNVRDVLECGWDALFVEIVVTRQYFDTVPNRNRHFNCRNTTDVVSNYYREMSAAEVMQLQQWCRSSNSLLPNSSDTGRNNHPKRCFVCNAFVYVYLWHIRHRAWLFYAVTSLVCCIGERVGSAVVFGGKGP